MRPVFVAFVAVFVVVLVAVAPVHAVVTGAIFGPGSQSFSIAVLPPRASGDAAAEAQRFARALTRDLDLSGYFRLVDPATFIERPDTAGVTAAETDFVGWAAIGAQAVVKGTLAVAGDGVTLEVRLLDVAGRADVPEVSRRYTGSRADVGRMAHKTADAILEFLTGERGPFDSQIAFVSTRSGRLKDVYRLTFDMDEPVRVTDERSLVVTPRWRPDGRALVFASYRQHQPFLFQVDLGTKQTARIAGGVGVAFDGAWSPDGSKLLVTHEEAGNTDVYLVDRSGQVLQRLTDHWAVDVAPVWAPDGRRLAFCSSRSGSPQVYVMNVDGSGLARVSRTGGYNTSPAWSPKGDRLAWASRGGGGFQIVVAGADGSGAREITRGGMNENPSWAPDGRYVVFSSTRGSRSRLVLADRDGRTQKELTRGGGDDTSPAWSTRLE
jgi:TolB protein